MNKIILAFDSFKGSVSSLQIADSVKQTINHLLPDVTVESFPIADGGEGTTKAICRNSRSQEISIVAHDPLMRPIKTSYNITSNGTAVIELAAASGLPLVEPAFRNPLDTTTFGTGEIILDALNHDCHTIILGIGGSATNDAALGILSALGYRFLDKDGIDVMPIGANLEYVATIDDSQADKRILEKEFIVACDVNNPFYGPNGAAHVYAPQKGASPKDVIILDNGLQHFAKIVNQKTGKDIVNLKGAGAAGGVGGTLSAILNATLKSGIETVLDSINFSDAISDADIIFTGEGQIDGQTTMGKALSGILQYAKRYNVPVIALAGSVQNADQLNELGFTAVYPIQNGPLTLSEAMNSETTLLNINNTVTQILRTIIAFEK